MIRWKYLLPRITLVIALLLVTKYVFPWVLKWSAIKSIRATTGFVANIDDVWMWPLQGKVRVDGVRIARQPSSQRNLVEYKSAVFSVDLASLMRRRAIVQQLEIRGIELGTSRTSSECDIERESLSGRQYGPWAKYGSDLGRFWWQSMSAGLQRRVEDQFDSLRLARQLSDRWSGQYDDLAREIAQCEQQVRQFRDKLVQLPNLLGNGAGTDTIQDVRRDAERLKLQIDQLHFRLRQMQLQLHTDRNSIATAWNEDRSRLRSAMRIARMDDGQLSTSLLTGEIHGWLDQVQPWLEVARWLTASPEVYGQRERGATIPFSSGVDPSGLIIRRAFLDGHIDICGQQRPFVGYAENVTTSLNQPTRIQFETPGTPAATVDMVVDRSDTSIRQSIKLNAQAVSIPGRTWGSTDGLAVSIEPAKSDVHLTMIASQDQLDGTLRIKVSDVRLLPVVAPTSGAELLQRQLATALSDLNSFEISAHFHGPKKSLQFDITSGLGRELESRVRRVFQQSLDEHANQLEQQANQLLAQQLDQLETDLSRRQAALTKRLDAGLKLVTSTFAPSLADRKSWTGLILH